MQTWALIVDAFREARDKRLFWILLAVSTVVGLALACVGFDDEGWSLFFGAIRMPFPKEMAGAFDPARLMAAFVSYMLVDHYIAWLGTLACLIATAGFIPNFLAQGAVEVVLGKPMWRVRIFLGKYIGALTFVLVQAAYFVLLTLAVLRFQGGQWFWGYLWAIPLLVLQFSYVYCVCALLGVLTRSTLAALILTLAFWATTSVATIGEIRLSDWDASNADVAGALSWDDRSVPGKVLHVTHLALPKTSDIPEFVSRGMGASGLDELTVALKEALPKGDEELREDVEDAAYRLQQEYFAKLTLAGSVGSSLAFEAVVLVIACWIFWRQDY